jgi:hypothetical protein
MELKEHLQAANICAPQVKEPAFGEQLKGLGIEIAGTSRAELDAFRADETKRISELVKAPGVDIK